MEDKNDVIVVKIGLFSGLPNPEVKLTGEMAVQYARLLKSAVGKEPIHQPPPPKLGEFYGFLILAPEKRARELDIPVQVNVFSGVINDMAPKKQAYWRDVSGIERFLIKVVSDQGFGELMRKIGFKESDLS
ncbi:MAG: hypothetical protein NT175_13140 [Bacteroidetes bacterium]|nr:hypothetical protein [Bacteroidota bacterium]